MKPTGRYETLALIPTGRYTLYVFNEEGELTSKKLIKLLEKKGWKLSRVKGSHHTFEKPGVSYHITVPHPTKDIATGTLQKILKQL